VYDSQRFEQFSDVLLLISVDQAESRTYQGLATSCKNHSGKESIAGAIRSFKCHQAQLSRRILVYPQKIDFLLVRKNNSFVPALCQCVGPKLFGRNGEGDTYFTDGELRFAVISPGGTLVSANPVELESPALSQLKDNLWSTARSFGPTGEPY
jgi:hypothetical protein